MGNASVETEGQAHTSW